MICVGMGKMSQGWGEGKHASGVNDDNNIGLSWVFVVWKWNVMCSHCHQWCGHGWCSSVMLLCTRVRCYGHVMKLMWWVDYAKVWVVKHKCWWHGGVKKESAVDHGWSGSDGPAVSSQYILSYVGYSTVSIAIKYGAQPVRLKSSGNGEGKAAGMILQVYEMAVMAMVVREVCQLSPKSPCLRGLSEGFLWRNSGTLVLAVGIQNFCLLSEKVHKTKIVS